MTPNNLWELYNAKPSAAIGLCSLGRVVQARVIDGDNRLMNKTGKAGRIARRLVGLPMRSRYRPVRPWEVAVIAAYLALLAWMWWRSRT
jgi:hypothetical protein